MIKNLLISFVFLASVCAQATVIVDYPLDENAGFGWNSNTGVQQIAEAFSTGSNTTATTITWWGFFQDNSTVGDFDVLFFNDVAGAPDASDFSMTSVSGVAGSTTGLDNGSGYTIYEFSMSLGAVALSAGDYWLSIRGSTNTPIFTWSHSSSDGSGSVWARFTDNDSWQEFGMGTRDLQSLRLTAIPEPASLLLIGLGLLGFRRFTR